MKCDSHAMLNTRATVQQFAVIQMLSYCCTAIMIRSAHIHQYVQKGAGFGKQKLTEQDIILENGSVCSQSDKTDCEQTTAEGCNSNSGES